MGFQTKTSKSKFKTDCIGVCQRRSGLCTGCGRTNDEIFEWIILSEDEKKVILATPRAD
ncbi:hypothetical protein PNIG_b0649 [Pseudoalteromonas nigrifaciens]|jgi:predicted Fe-S protein YdhL (DUF1289 family)|uniref:Fe-S protein n=1 Tax=Pseudoalteromonas nigrifaciens TaxID=28109 RepID=A0AAC9UP50_9GAMM|nr:MULTISPECIES: DUF1289 domain-containing protein [Pseudoalteromonas]ASM56201.1 hypothetical protein PNIG_b0649 [Pseudoalteromonas nigrifaciens]MBB1370465.1 DUF1289 domain-containing protein [Pseudoalteromonas sp. SR45-4]MBE0419422.1 DUF1289 domain-containing protein [Pseudoalteromonas nigrifaciens]PCC10557.1 DUF1289 domain-containing protein [Pseudoalteromonas sp. JB197]SJN46364.1 hypothetical protein CZ797_13575 [Pseudoalteromonas sp. JB197]